MGGNVYRALIEGVHRYIKSTKYPHLSVVCAILGIHIPNQANSYSINLTNGEMIYGK